MSDRKPLWRIPVMWLVVGLPLASIIAGVGLVVIAVRSGGADSVTDDVQRMAQVQTTDLGPDQQAQTMKLSAVVRVDAGRIEVIPVSGDFDRKFSLQLTLLHPTQARDDQVLALLPSARGWQGQVPIDDSHDWKLLLQPLDARWRLKGRLPRQQYAARMAPAVATE